MDGVAVAVEDKRVVLVVVVVPLMVYMQ